MKILIALIVFVVSCAVVVPTTYAGIEKPAKAKAVVKKKPLFTPEVELFLRRCVDDSEKKYENAETWLLNQKDTMEPKQWNSMMEILSGLVWNIDRARARILAKEVTDNKLREEIFQLYDTMEGLPQQPVEKEKKK